MSTEEEQDLQEFIDLRARIRELERTIELLVAAGHVTEEQVEKARKLAISLSPASPGPSGHLIKIEGQEYEELEALQKHIDDLEATLEAESYSQGGTF